MKLNGLKSELKEKEKGCGRLMGFPADNPRVKCGDNCKTIQGKRICGFCKAKIEYLKKGISACEEILNQSQQLKSEVSENSSLSEEAQTKGIVGEFNNNVKETSVETAGNPLGFSSQSADILIKQALSQRNKEILEIIDKWETKQPIDQKYKMEKKGIFYNIYNVSELNLQELKKQLTNSEGKE